jgi:prepilin-type N-terminal cleavage/methylation domain-containing protein
MRARPQSLSGTYRTALVYRMRRAPEAGFTLVELIVTMLILSIVFGITMGLIIGLKQQQVNLSATVAGANQSQLASQEVIQYLRAASSPVSGSAETANGFVLPAYIGQSTNPLAIAPQSVTVSAQYTTGHPGGLTGTGSLEITFTGGAITRQIATYYVLAPATNTPMFSYWMYNPASPGNLQMIPWVVTTPVTNPPQINNACLSDIVAVEINASFFAGPQDLPTRGYAIDIATTVNTTVFLRNSNLVFGSTTVAPTVTTAPPVPAC